MDRGLLTSRIFLRNFHYSLGINGSAIKSKLDMLHRQGIVIEKTSKEQRKFQAKRNTDLSNKRKSSYSKQKAQHILKTKYGFDSSTEVGPTSKSDAKALTLTNDKRLITTILGTNYKQLKDSKLVAKDVEKFCKRGQLQKAFFLIKVSGKKGIVAANILMNHYLKVEKDAKSALHIYNYRKKWQIPPNEYTENILFDGLSKLKSAVTEKVAQQILKIVRQLVEQDKLSNITFNSALGALSNCPNPNYTFECYELRPKGVEKDSITYTRLLMACTRFTNPVEAIQKADLVMNQVNPRLIDSQLFFHYMNVWHSRTEKDFFLCVLPLLHNFFSITAIPKDSVAIPDFVSLPTLETWGLREPLTMNKYVLHLLLENCLKSGQYLIGIECFEECLAHSEKFITEKNVSAMLRLITKQNPFDCAYKCADFYNSIENSGALRETTLPLVLTYKAFERQALKKRVNADPVCASSLVNSCIDFAKEKESIVVTLPDQGTITSIKWRSWLFLWNVVKQCEGSLTIEERKNILDEFLNTKLHDESMDISKKGRQNYDLRFVYLEGVRFVNRLEQSLVLQENELNQIKKDPEDLDSLEKKKFLLKRHLLRLRKGLIEIVEGIEGKVSSGEGETKNAFATNCKFVLASNLK